MPLAMKVVVRSSRSVAMATLLFSSFGYAIVLFEEHCIRKIIDVQMCR